MPERKAGIERFAWRIPFQLRRSKCYLNQAVYYAFRACIADRFSKWAILLTRLLHLVILPKPMTADPYQGWKQVMVIMKSSMASLWLGGETCAPA
jgi:hypothetical protein